MLPLILCLKDLPADYIKDTYTADKAAGICVMNGRNDSAYQPDVVIGVGAFDAHMGAVGGQI